MKMQATTLVFLALGAPALMGATTFTRGEAIDDKQGTEAHEEKELAGPTYLYLRRRQAEEEDEDEQQRDLKLWKKKKGKKAMFYKKKGKKDGTQNGEAKMKYKNKKKRKKCIAKGGAWNGSRCRQQAPVDPTLASAAPKQFQMYFKDYLSNYRSSDKKDHPVFEDRDGDGYISFKDYYAQRVARKIEKVKKQSTGVRS